MGIFSQVRFPAGGIVAAYLRIVTKLSNIMYACAGVMLSFMMVLTVADVVLRYLGRPIPGTYELVGLSGAVVIGFAIPYTSLVRGHIFVEFLIDRFEKGRREVVLMINENTHSAALYRLRDLSLQNRDGHGRIGRGDANSPHPLLSGGLRHGGLLLHRMLGHGVGYDAAGRRKI